MPRACVYKCTLTGKITRLTMIVTQLNTFCIISRGMSCYSEHLSTNLNISQQERAKCYTKYMGEYLTTGLFVSGSIASVIFINKSLNLVLFNKYSLFLIILKFSIKFNSNSLEKLRCQESMSYTNKCNGKMSELQSSKFDLIFSRIPSTK